ATVEESCRNALGDPATRGRRSAPAGRGRGASVLVGRGGVEPPTFHFSGGRSYQLSYLPKRRTPYMSSPRRRQLGPAAGALWLARGAPYAVPCVRTRPGVGPHRLAAQDPALSRR